MWEQTLIESRGTSEGKRKWLTVPVSMLIHGLVIGTLIMASYWFVEAVEPPPIPVTLFSAPPPPPPPPLAAPKKKPEVKKEEVKPVDTKEYQQKAIELRNAAQATPS